jgi:hypothetical protein
MNLNAAMGSAVLNHLQQFASMEDVLRFDTATGAEGFIAGQAVASAVSELYGDGRGVVYNDVDAFLLSAKYGETKKDGVLATMTNEQLVVSAQYSQLTWDSHSTYTVCSTRRDGMLNEVLCTPHMSMNDNRHQAAQSFLKSFDLNCVQVGIRLSDQQLVWTPAFEKFMTTREMLVENIKTPLHTAVRWFKKKAELEGIYGHDEKSMELLGAMLARIRERQEEYGDCTTLENKRAWRAQTHFGRGYAEKAEAVASDLSRFFNLTAVDGFNIPLHTLTPQGDVDRRITDAPCPDLALPTYARAVQGHWRKHTCQQVLEAFEDSSPRVLRINICTEGVEALQAQRNPGDMVQLDRMLSEHPGLTPWLVEQTTARQLAFGNALRQLVKREGLWVYGLFEQFDMRMEANKTKMWATPTKEIPAAVEGIFQQELQVIAELQAKAAVNALKEPVHIAGFNVSELINYQDLVDEGMRMHHCVQGYFRNVVEGHSRIFRFQKHRVQDSLTLELRPTGLGWTLAQFRGIQNRAASDEELVAAKQLVTSLTLQALLSKACIKLPLTTMLRCVARHPETAAALEPLAYPKASMTAWMQSGRWTSSLYWTWRTRRGRMHSLSLKCKALFKDKGYGDLPGRVAEDMWSADIPF